VAHNRPVTRLIPKHEQDEGNPPPRVE